MNDALRFRYPSIITGRDPPKHLPKCYLLNLPLAIRRQIYLYCGFPTNRLLHLPNSLQRRILSLLANQDLAISVNLLLVCCKIYEELSSILYGENLIVVTSSQTTELPLSALNNLTNVSLRNLRQLSIRVKVCPMYCTCRPEKDHSTDSRDHCWRHPNTNLELRKDADSNFLANWAVICGRLSRVSRPGSLSLFLAVDCDDVTTAEAVTRPLRQLPVLADCVLRLASKRNDHIQGLARETVNLLIRKRLTTNTLSFKYLQLPTEIRLRILEYACQRDDIHIIRAAVSIGTKCGPACHAVEITGTRIRSHDLVKCYCERSHSAASNGRCQCLLTGFPFSYFLVSKQFRQMATEAFYGQNQFIVSSCRTGLEHSSLLGDGDADTQPELDADLHLSRLHSISPYAISHLTNLRLEFNYFDFNTPHIAELDWKVWDLTIERISKYGNLPSLRIVVCVPDAWLWWPRKRNWHTMELDSDMTISENKLLHSYARTLEPFSMLVAGGLKSFKISFDCESGEFDIDLKGEERPDKKRQLRMLEQKFENLVFKRTAHVEDQESKILHGIL